MKTSFPYKSDRSNPTPSGRHPALYRHFLAGLLFLLVTFAAAQTTAFAQTTIYVDADAGGSNDGSSWANAHPSLQDALATATSGDEIWVAEGVYTPGTPANLENVTDAERQVSFVLKDGISVYGGFAGNEGSLNERNWQTNPTILSGDIDGNDGLFEPDVDSDNDPSTFTQTDHINGTNSFHVVVIPLPIYSSPYLDGVTITAGYANGEFGDSSGGGIDNGNGGNPILVNVSFLGNHANNLGGGMLNSWFDGQTFKSTPTLTNVSFIGNSASSSGGGMSNIQSNPVLTGGVFFGNISGGSGGGIDNSGSNPELTNITITGNSSESLGGGIYNLKNSSPTLTNVILWGNEWIKCDICSASPPADNMASLDILGDSDPVISNSLLEDSGGSGSGWLPFGIDEGGNIDANPRFLSTDPEDPEFLHLSNTSPAINAGTNTPFEPGEVAEDVTTDLAGNDRIYNSGTVDMGAYEFQDEPSPVIPGTGNILYVKKGGDGNQKGYSWSNALPELTDALDWAHDAWDGPGTLHIWVAQGTYYPDEGAGRTNNDRNASFALKDNVAVYGGFAGTEGPEFNPDNRDFEANSTILSGDIDGNDDSAGSSSNAYHVVTGSDTDATAVLDGFTITAGNANGGGFPNNMGGGMFNIGSGSPTVTNITFFGNSAGDRGGGMFNQTNSSPTLTNITFSGNQAGTNGGGMVNEVASSPVLTNVTFSGNSAGTHGGGMYNSVDSFPTLTNVIIWNNEADGDTTSSSASIYNNDTDSNPAISYSLIASSGGSGSGWNADIGDDNGNIMDTNPQFIDPGNGDYSLKSTSPAINTGTNTPFENGGVGEGISTDLASNDRIYNSDIIDMGAYEFQGEPETPLTLTVDEGWRMLSSPIAGQSYADMLAPLWTQGVPGSKYEGDANTFSNVYTWNTGYGGDCVSEYDNNDECVGWQVPSTADFENAIPPGSGFLMYVFEDDNFDGTISSGEEFSNSKTLTLTGTRHSGDVSPAINANGGGWTLVGNPYGGPMSFSALELSEVNNVAYIYDPNASGIDPSGPTNGNGGAWRSTDGTYGEITDGVIAPGQGFFVQTASSPTGTPSLTFSESDQTTGGEFYGKEAEPRDYVRLEIQGESLYNSAWIRFSENGSTERTEGEALKLQPLSANYAMLAARKTDGTLMDIAHYPLGEQNLEIPLAVGATQSGQFIIRATDLDLPAGMTLYLYDRKTRESIPIGEDFEYRFDLEVSDQGKNIPLSQLTEGTKGGVSQTKSISPKKGSPSAQASRSTGAVGPAKATTRGTDRFLITTRPGGPTGELPGEVALGQNYPNPFNPSTVISYQLPVNSKVRLEVYDMLGRNVATLVDEQVAAGRHQVNFDASNLSSGVYLYQLQTGSHIITKKLTLIK